MQEDQERLAKGWRFMDRLRQSCEKAKAEKQASESQASLFERPGEDFPKGLREGEKQSEK